MFSTLLSIAWFLGFYNLTTVFILCMVFFGLAYKEVGEYAKAMVSPLFSFPNHDFSDKSSFFQKLNLHLLTSEFFFIVISFLISVNFINIVRPMPIGWDDLWVYMNYPNLMAAAWQVLPLGMAPWQVFTGIGYMFGSATQSFFMNNVGWILSLLVIVLGFWDLIKSRYKTFINLPLLAGAMFLSMPMVVFQQAKDMKLDPALFFLSAIVIYATLYIFTKYLGYSDKQNIDGVEIMIETSPEKEEISMVSSTKKSFFSYFSSFEHIGEGDLFSHKSYLAYIALLWVIAWFAFSVKITSLLLISWILWVFFYSKLWMAGFLSYLSFYVWIFTKLGLWDMMFVVYPKDDMSFRNTFFYVSIIIWSFLLWYSIYKYSYYAFQKLMVLVVLFLVWVWVWVSPWMLKNIIEAKGEISIGVLLNGKPDYFHTDYLKIYTQEEIDAINKKVDNALVISSSGTTTNEDMGRYFGYEEGINNYVKLPYNLTMQKNQRGEFTDITYYYLAIIPVIVLFLAFKFEVLSLWIFALSLAPLLLFFNQNVHAFFTQIFSKMTLPGGYILLAWLFLVPFFYMMYSLNREKLSVVFKINLVFALFYIFLWTISAFGIVWYGVAMYYSLLLIIVLGGYAMVSYKPEDIQSENIETQKYLTIKFLGSLVFLFVATLYFFQSAFPHGFANIKSASYEAYKAGIMNNYVSIFESHSDYYDALSELNIKKEKQDDLVQYIIQKVQSQELKAIITNNKIDNLLVLNDLFKQIAAEKSNSLEIAKLKSEANTLRSELYKMILYPIPEFKNDVGIYRIGTFLRFFIADNYKRLLEDSLIMEFSKYFYDKNNVDVAVEKMKKIGVNYFLVDLNAATIDRDPRHDLTNRYESLLHTFTSEKLELLQTDSVCLKIALEDYKKSLKTQEDLQKYFRMAWVNYESYPASGWVLNRWEKQLECYNYILSLMSENKVNEKDYNYLLPIQNYLSSNKITSQEELLNFFRNYVTHGWMVLFRIKD